MLSLFSDMRAREGERGNIEPLSEMMGGERGGK